MIQVTGVTMTSDSMEVVPFIPIKINHQDDGIRSGMNGVFSFVCNKGDEVSFGGIGFEEQTIKIPSDLKGAHYTMVLFLNHDTFYMPTVIFRQEIPSGRDFDYAFRYWDMDEDMIMVGRRNATTNNMEYQLYALPYSGAEAQTNYFNQMHLQNARQNMTPSLNLLKVPDFLNAWRRGDLKRKTSKDYKK